MAIIINPDGTVSTIETTHDQYGNLRPKIDSGVMQEQEIHYNKNTISETKENKGYVYPTSSVSKRYKKKVNISRTIPPKKQKTFISTAEIDMFFKDRISSRKRITEDEYVKMLLSLPEALKDYFASRYLRYKGYRPGMDEDFRARKTFKKPKNKKKKHKAPHEVQEVHAIPTAHSAQSHSGHSLGEIARISSMHKRTPEGDMVNGKSLLGASRKPKYGYARDRYGRVQERDSYNEDLHNEFRNAQNRQRNYDYSSYDANDDNDGAYSGWE